MTLKELSRYYNLQKQLERSRELLASLEASASPRAQALTGMPHSSGAGDKVGDLAAEIADTKAHIQRLERRAEQAAVRIRAEPPPVSSILPVLATAPRLMAYSGFGSFAV